jgi:hypothetical protein
MDQISPEDCATEESTGRGVGVAASRWWRRGRVGVIFLDRVTRAGQRKIRER